MDNLVLNDSGKGVVDRVGNLVTPRQTPRKNLGSVREDRHQLAKGHILPERGPSVQFVLSGMCGYVLVSLEK